jgi:hypothetical protein
MNVSSVPTWFLMPPILASGGAIEHCGFESVPLSGRIGAHRRAKSCYHGAALFACGSKLLNQISVCGFSARSAEKQLRTMKRVIL